MVSFTFDAIRPPSSTSAEGAARKADLAAAVAHQVSTARLGKRTLPSIADAADGGEAPSPKKARA